MKGGEARVGPPDDGRRIVGIEEVDGNAPAAVPKTELSCRCRREDVCFGQVEVLETVILAHVFALHDLLVEAITEATELIAAKEHVANGDVPVGSAALIGLVARAGHRRGIGIRADGRVVGREVGRESVNDVLAKPCERPRPAPPDRPAVCATAVAVARQRRRTGRPVALEGAEIEAFDCTSCAVALTDAFGHVRHAFARRIEVAAQALAK